MLTIRQVLTAMAFAVALIIGCTAAAIYAPIPALGQDAVATVDVTPAPLAPDTTVVVNEPSGDTIVTIPVDDIVTKFLGWVRDIVITAAIAAIGWAGRWLPKTLVNWLLQNIVEKNLVRAIDYGINAVSGAVRGMTLDLNVGSAVVAEALQYAVDHAPGWLIKWLGGPARIRDMIIARIPLDSMATAEAVARNVGKPPLVD